MSGLFFSLFPLEVIGLSLFPPEQFTVISCQHSWRSPFPFMSNPRFPLPDALMDCTVYPSLFTLAMLHGVRKLAPVPLFFFSKYRATPFFSSTAKGRAHCFSYVCLSHFGRGKRRSLFSAMVLFLSFFLQRGFFFFSPQTM